MNHITALMLAQSIQHDRREATRRDRYPRPSGSDRPARPSHWNAMLRVYQLGFASKP